MWKLLCLSLFLSTCVKAGDYTPESGKNSAAGKLAAAVAKQKATGGSGDGASSMAGGGDNIPSNHPAPSDQQAPMVDPPAPDNGKYTPEKGQGSAANKLALAVEKMNGGDQGAVFGGQGSMPDGGKPNSVSSPMGNIPVDNGPDDTPARKIAKEFDRLHAH